MPLWKNFKLVKVDDEDHEIEEVEIESTDGENTIFNRSQEEV